MSSELLSVERFDDPTAFLDRTQAYLIKREAEHMLLFGIASSLQLDPDRSEGPPYLAAARRGGEVVAAAILTPPYNVVLSCIEDPEALGALVEDLDSAGYRPRGVSGPTDIAHAFAERWSERLGLAATVGLRERIYRAERVVPPTGIPGRARIARLEDRDLLIDWAEAFLLEALGREARGEAVDLIDRSMRTGTRIFHVWEDGRPVSFAGVAGPTPNGIRIGPVYTPPEFRGHGYGSAITAAATEAQFDQGRRYVFLFTDLANPTSNKIYQAIGYEAVIDVVLVHFEAPSPGRGTGATATGATATGATATGATATGATPGS
jgi:predicted GNAT family acetyltransferase